MSTRTNENRKRSRRIEAEVKAIHDQSWKKDQNMTGLDVAMIRSMIRDQHPINLIIMGALALGMCALPIMLLLA